MSPRLPMLATFVTFVAACSQYVSVTTGGSSEPDAGASADSGLVRDAAAMDTSTTDPCLALDLLQGQGHQANRWTGSMLMPAPGAGRNGSNAFEFPLVGGNPSFVLSETRALRLNGDAWVVFWTKVTPAVTPPTKLNLTALFTPVPPRAQYIDIATPTTVFGCAEAKLAAMDAGPRTFRPAFQWLSVSTKASMIVDDVRIYDVSAGTQPPPACRCP
jgi:hypothetical protein